MVDIAPTIQSLAATESVFAPAQMRSRARGLYERYAAVLNTSRNSAVHAFFGRVCADLARLRLNSRKSDMAKGEQRGNREARKPKKPSPPKQNASNPSLKGAPPPPAKK
jgi:hypothetical protein